MCGEAGGAGEGPGSEGMSDPGTPGLGEADVAGLAAAEAASDSGEGVSGYSDVAGLRAAEQALGLGYETSESGLDRAISESISFSLQDEESVRTAFSEAEAPQSFASEISTAADVLGKVANVAKAIGVASVALGVPGIGIPAGLLGLTATGLKGISGITGIISKAESEAEAPTTSRTAKAESSISKTGASKEQLESKYPQIYQEGKPKESESMVSSESVDNMIEGFLSQNKAWAQNIEKISEYLRKNRYSSRFSIG